MEFGSVTTPENIHFVLPPEPPRNRILLSQIQHQLSQQNKIIPKIYIGAPVWSCPEWQGNVYPQKCSPKDYLKWYCKQFNCIELNSTFYTIPELKTLQNWREQTHEDFRFIPKVWQNITHLKQLRNIDAEWALFLEHILVLENRLGPLLLQLPPSFQFKNFSTLRRFFKMVPRFVKLSVELRHPSWYSNQILKPEVQLLFEEFNFIPIITDTSGKREILHSNLATHKTLIRFLGNDLHHSDFTRLNDWGEKLLFWIESGVSEVYFFVHHPTILNIPASIRYFIDYLNQLGLQPIKNWQNADEVTNPTSPLKPTMLSEQLQFQL